MLLLDIGNEDCVGKCVFSEDQLTFVLDIQPSDLLGGTRQEAQSHDRKLLQIPFPVCGEITETLHALVSQVRYPEDGALAWTTLCLIWTWRTYIYQSPDKLRNTWQR